MTKSMTPGEIAWLREQQAFARKLLALVQDPLSGSLSASTINELKHLLRWRGYVDGKFVWDDHE